LSEQNPTGPDEEPAIQGAGGGKPQSADGAEVQRRYIHSDIYERLVRAEDDLTGLVAYGIYQAAKRRWIVDFETRKKCSPSEDEIRDYVHTYDQAALDRLSKQAIELIFRVTNEQLKVRIEQMTPDLVNERLRLAIDDLRETVKERTGFRHHIFAHVAGFFALLGLFVLVLVGANVGEPLEWVIHRLGLAK